MKQELQAVKTNGDLVTIFKTNVARQEREFRAALPTHIPVERFTRVLTTAVVNNPALLEADRRTLFEAAMKAAQDGLLPDGREGALVIFNTKIKDNGKDIWINRVQWMPMIAGVLKKVRNSGELLSIAAYVAYSNDEFTYELGDEERIMHRPSLGDERGEPRLVYAIAKTKDGGIYREIMTVADIEKVRAVSKMKDGGPWVSWWSEMARKTVLRRLCKRLPMSSDLDDLIRRDDSSYDFEGETGAVGSPKHLASRILAETPEDRLKADLDALAAGGNGNGDPLHDPETGEIMSAEMAERAHAAAINDPTGEKATVEQTISDALDLGTQRLLDDGRAAASKGALKFKYWHGRVTQQHADQLAPYFDQLRAEANAVDAAKESA